MTRNTLALTQARTLLFLQGLHVLMHLYTSGLILISMDGLSGIRHLWYFEGSTIVRQLPRISTTARDKLLHDRTAKKSSHLTQRRMDSPRLVTELLEERGGRNPQELFIESLENNHQLSNYRVPYNHIPANNTGTG
ncbi:hypothetical protein GALMADRAFT_828569 [Galerina marginata CBS 339.88]|uniref:Uncharacterized protein n=1 Tax=Galerina marginata (strain CBS 339.88) TaxID=685588 RepID=A0A067TRK6_GALM3|nr:hypothetical protein GALMADRAFT_828569 [Galerina marginata CBS 339.88]